MADKESQTPKVEPLDKKNPCQVTYYIEQQAFQGTSTHFNERGILVNCPQPAPLNTKVRLALQFPGLKNIIELQGEVVWTNIHGPAETLSPRGMGVRFSNIDRDMERLLAELASQFDTQASIFSCYYS
ncbi:MAG: hypothetical protein GX443_03150 [Deltaproteobacteria bacterium]|nr:hypothetical protein [Deltaproteobacteria bacterium]